MFWKRPLPLLTFWEKSMLQIESSLNWWRLVKIPLKWVNSTTSTTGLRDPFTTSGKYNIIEEITSKMQKVQSFGPMVDEVMDISVQYQMLTFIQFVSSITSCVSVQNVLEEFASANSNNLTALTKGDLQHCGLKIENMKSLTTDGAAARIGKNGSVASQLKAQNPNKP